MRSRRSALWRSCDRAGCCSPCSPQTSLPLFDGVYADIGDQQSIEHAVSTFSSHVTAIAGVLAHATPRSLVLFDELGTSTDPEEGAALGCAVAAHLAEQGVPCVVTTHHRPLAALAEEHDAMENASVELDPQTLRPTYKLTMGLPGRSYAMDIADRTGLDARIIEAAQQRLGPVHRETEGLLTAIRWERALTREKLDEAEAERARAAELSAELAQQVEALESAQASAVEEVRAELRQEANRVRAKLRQAESAAEWQTFRGEPPPPRVLESASADVADVQRALRSRVWGKRPVSAPTERKTKLAVGETVEVGALGIKGAVLTEPDSAGRVEVLVGSARLQMNVSRLRRAGEPARRGASRPSRRLDTALHARARHRAGRARRARQRGRRTARRLHRQRPRLWSYARSYRARERDGRAPECGLATARGQQRGCVVCVRAARTGRGRRDRGRIAVGTRSRTVAQSHRYTGRERHRHARVSEMQTIGLGLLLLGLVGLLGVGVYYALAELFAADEVPFLIRLFIAAVIVGFVVLMASVVRDRIRESKSERFEEVDR